MSKLIDLEKCHFGDIIKLIFQKVKFDNVPLLDVEFKYGEQIARLLTSRRQYSYRFLNWTAMGGEALLVKLIKSGKLGESLVVAKIAAPHFNTPGDRTIKKTPTQVLPRIAFINTARERFKRGVKNQIELSENIVATKYGIIPRVYDFEETPVLYYVMDYVGGTTLDEWALKGVSREKRMSMFLTILKFINEIHLQQSFAHRDIKPSNIIISNHKPSLIDFTTGKSLNESDPEVTVFQSGMGSKIFTAPEVRTDSRDSDTRSDIYSLAQLMAFMWLPWTANNAEIYTCETPNKLLEKFLHGSLQPVYRKAAMPSKSDRYQLLDHFIKDFESANKQGQFLDEDLVPELLKALSGWEYCDTIIELYSAINNIFKSK